MHRLDPLPDSLPGVSDTEYQSLLSSHSIVRPKWESRPGGDQELGTSHINKNCVTCKGKGHFPWRYEGEPSEYVCPCFDQWTLDLLFEAANIRKHLRVLGLADATGLPEGSMDFLAEHMIGVEEFVDRGRGVIISGTSGGGKTLMASLIMRAFLRDGYTAYITDILSLWEWKKQGFDDEIARVRFERKVKQVDLLVMDDLSQTLQSTEWRGDTFSDVLNQRRGKPTLLISQEDTDWLYKKYYGAVDLLREMEHHQIKKESFLSKRMKRDQDERGLQRPRVLV